MVLGSGDVGKVDFRQDNQRVGETIQAIRDQARIDGGEEAADIEDSDVDLEQYIDSGAVYTPLTLLIRGQFRFVIADEGHAVKNPRAVAHRMIDQLDKEFLIVASATPILNSVYDMLGYVDLLWPKYLPFSYNRADDSTAADVFYDPGLSEAVAGDDSFEGIGYARLCSGGSDMRDVDGGVRDRELTPLEQGIADRYREEVRAGRPVWHLCPALFRAFAAQAAWNYDFCGLAIGSILDQVQIKRTMLTEMRLPDGRVESPGSNLPRCSLRVVELGIDPAKRAEVDKVVEELSHRVFTGPDGKILPDISNTGIIIPDSAKNNANVLRRLALSSTDIRYDFLTRPTARLLRSMRDPEAMQQAALKLKLVREKTARAGRKTAARKTSGQAKKSSAQAAKTKVSPTGGVAEVNRVYGVDRDLGCSWFFLSTRPNPSFPVPTDRLSMLQYVSYYSPKISYGLRRVIVNSRAGRRTLVYAANPLTVM